MASGRAIARHEVARQSGFRRSAAASRKTPHDAPQTLLAGPWPQTQRVQHLGRCRTVFSLAVLDSSVKRRAIRNQPRFRLELPIIALKTFAFAFKPTNAKLKSVRPSSAFHSRHQRQVCILPVLQELLIAAFSAIGVPQSPKCHSGQCSRGYAPPNEPLVTS